MYLCRFNHYLMVNEIFFLRHFLPTHCETIFHLRLDRALTLNFHFKGYINLLLGMNSTSIKSFFNCIPTQPILSPPTKWAKCSFNEFTELNKQLGKFQTHDNKVQLIATNNICAKMYTFYEWK